MTIALIALVNEEYSFILSPDCVFYILWGKIKPAGDTREKAKKQTKKKPTPKQLKYIKLVSGKNAQN